MTSHAAVAAAIRQRLIEGRPAPLRGLGTLVRQHVASRIEERPDGTRVLLPPGETIGLAAEAVREESLADAYARFRGVDDAEAEAAYAAAMDQIEARLAATGEVRLPGVGLLRRTSGGIVLGVEADLLQAVNRTYEGLPPVAAGPTPEATASPEAPAPSPPRRPPPPPLTAPPVERVPPSDPAPSPAPSPPTPAPTPAPPPPAAASPEPEPPAPAPPEPPPSSPAAASFADETPAFGGFADEPGDVADGDDLDDDLLGDVVSDAMPAPFGDPGGRPLADLLPPTPPERRPPPEAPPSAPSSSVDDWGEETWTAPAFDDAPLRNDEDFGRPDRPTADPFEDADFDVVPSPPTATPAGATPPAPPRAEPDAAPPPEPLDEDPAPVAEPEPLASSPDVVFAQALGPEEGVEVEPPAGAAMPIEPPPAEAPVPAPEPTPQADDEDTGDRTATWLWALFVVLLIAALAAAAVWFWPAVERSLFPRLGTPTEQPTDAGPQTVSDDDDDDPAPGSAPADAGTGAAPAAGTALASQPAGGGVASGPAAPDGPTVSSARAPATDGRALAPPSDQAILPPVLAGLSATDRDALSGRDPVDPEAVAWTLVVLSTPSRADAAALVRRYRQAGYRASVLETVSGSRPMFRVAVGQFPDRDAAIRLRDRLPPQAPPDTWALDLQTL